MSKRRGKNLLYKCLTTYKLPDQGARTFAHAVFNLSAGGKWYLPYEVDIADGSKNWLWNAMVGAGFRFHWGDVMLGFRNITYQRSGDAFLQKAPADRRGATLRW